MTQKKQDKSKIIQIWGDILDEGFTSVPNLLLRYRSILGIKPQHLSLIIDIMSFKWDIYSPFPSYTTLAKRAGVDERTIKRITQDLEELGFLIKEPRFDEISGAQITTIFDFRPLVKKLTEERNRILEENTKNTHHTGNFDWGDKNVTGGGDKNVTGGVTNKSRGGVTKMSPKEYTYINNTNINKSTYSNVSKITANNKIHNDLIIKEKVHTHLKNGIYKKRLYETFDNLIGIKPIEGIIEEGIYKALKDITTNRTIEIGGSINEKDIDKITIKIANKFPYEKIPVDIKQSRKFYANTISKMIIDELL